MDSIASFAIETGGQKGHVMWILTNQQEAWWCNALQLPSEKILWTPSIQSSYRSGHVLVPSTSLRTVCGILRGGQTQWWQVLSRLHSPPPHTNMFANSNSVFSKQTLFTTESHNQILANFSTHVVQQVIISPAVPPTLVGLTTTQKLLA